jgi:NAD-dependent SIR2 family protein deacetylase
MNPVTKQSEYPKQVFFLGAGASALAGVPTFANFYETAEDIYKKKLLNKKSNKQFERVLKYWKKNFDKCNIEEFYSAVEMLEMLDDTIKDNQEIVTTDDIESFIYSTIQKSVKSDIIIKNIYGLFLKNIPIRSGIITTNWDIVLETSSDEFSIKNEMISYELGQPYNKKEPERVDSDGEILAQLRDVAHHSILKLHGSLNWGFCDRCGKIYYFDEKIHDILATNNGVVCNNDKCKGKLSLIIVPPKLSKLIKPEQITSELNIELNPVKSPYFQLRSIWSKANEYLKMCEEIYFIGYSFPETDVQMKTFISNALRENSNLDKLKIIIVSSQKHGNSRVEFEERYLSILSKFIIQSKIKFCYDGFKEFCIDLVKSRNPHLQ